MPKSRTTVTFVSAPRIISGTSRFRSIGRASAASRSCSFRTSPTGARNFFGAAKSTSKPREEWDRFFGDYETWIVQMARVAEAHGAGIFCIGLEFTYAQKFDARWRKIIAAVRQVYHGKLTYGGNWDSFQEVTFWDALDYIGVLAYFPLTKSVNPSRGRNRGRLGAEMCRTARLFESAWRQEISLRRDRLQRERPRRGRAVGVQDGRRERGRNPAALH